MKRTQMLFAVLLALFAMPFANSGEADKGAKTAPSNTPPPKAVGGTKDKAEENEPAPGENSSKVQVANLIYAGVRSSVCFSDHFLHKAETESSISTTRRFHSVKLSSPELFKFPFVIMTGEGAFTLLEEERTNLRKYCEKGGLLLASAGCSSPDWDRSFRAEMTRVFADKPFKAIPMEHALFKTVYEIKAIKLKHGKPKPLEGIEINGRLGVVYSSDGLNDTAHVKGCCCCGGNEIYNSEEININILAYALTQ